MTAGFRLAIDIGGTFTDGVLVRPEDGETWTAKALTTPADPTVGFMEVAERLVSDAGASFADVDYVIHATTVGTNAVIERRGVSTAFITTRGFRDILEIGRQVRHELYNLQTEKPRPLVDRRRSFEVTERLDHSGKIITPLDEDDVRGVIRQLGEQDIEAVAVCLLHSYRNPAHEQRIGELIAMALPDIEVSLSSEVAPEIREFWRASTTVINAYLSPICARYVGRLEQKLKESGCVAPLTLMQSNAGIMTAESARQRPILLLESGPAAGVSAAAFFSTLLGFEDSIAFDMGGTTAKVGLVRGGKATVLPEFEVGAAGWSGTTLVKASGYPVLASVVDLVEVGAGGGSLAWIDAGGSLRVGPQSAGASPGPACYGQGGTLPTITDANVVLGRLDPDYFLGGELPLDKAAAGDALSTLADGLGLDAIAAASGVLAIADATMAEAMRLISVHRGYDPRSSILVATGGAGPVHAVQLARDLEIPEVLVPPSPGVASAFGMLVSDLRHDYRTTHQTLLLEADPAELLSILHRFEQDAVRQLTSEGTDTRSISISRGLDMRYKGQSWTLTTSIDPQGDGDRSIDLSEMRQRFDSEHRRIYGYSSPSDPVEVVNVTLTAIGTAPKPTLKRPNRGTSGPDAAMKGSRPVLFDIGVGWVLSGVYDRYRLSEGNSIAGPAVIEERDSTVLVHPGWTADVQRYGSLLIRKQPGR